MIYAFEVVARRAGSECDPVLRVLDAKGSIVTEADDTRGLGKDARIEWKAPADGRYVLQVSDLHDRGGAAFGYVLLAEAASPDFTLTCDPDLINVGPGGRVPVFVRVTRRNGFAGAVSLGWQGLPAGVTASPLTIGPAMTEGVIVVSAAPETKHSGGPGGSRGDGPGSRAARSSGGRNRWKRSTCPAAAAVIIPVETLALAVTDPSDIAVEATPARGRAGARRIGRARRDRDPACPLRAGRQPGDRAPASGGRAWQPAAAGGDRQGGRQQDVARSQGDQGEDHPPGGPDRARRATRCRSP